MGFYGNITNTARTQFQFDRVYANRYEMEQKTSTDGVYAGRYCLVEYDREVHTDTLRRVWEFDGAYYTANSKDATNLLTWGNTTNGMVVFTAETSSEPEDNIYNIKICEFYARVAKPDEAKNSDAAQFIKIADGADAPAYTINYKIDTEAFQIGRGYDSTVWQKVYTDGSEKYVMIAELNTVVPTFDVVADAPTMSPIVPHFDTQSTDVYYKLHWQTPWGFRIAAADNLTQSDAVTSWIKYKYNADTGITIPQCYDPLHEEADEDGWRDQTEAEQKDPVLLPKHDAAIYFNRAAFDPKDISVKRISEYRAEDNIIKITPTGHSGEKYNKHDGSLDTAALPDTQELTIHLPEIGNMMSDAWDIIHGPLRNDDMRQIDPSTNQRVDSLQGRLNSIAALEPNEIPIKREDNGALQGTRINGDVRNTSTDNYNAELSSSYENDDAWIETKVDADNAPNAIAIHHTFHKTPSSTSSINKNNSAIVKSADYKEGKMLSENLTADKDQLRLYVPYVDKAGHVVGQNIETVTLPYSYREFITDGASEVENDDLYTEIWEDEETGDDISDVNVIKGSTSADETQDTMHINPYNKWIQVEVQDDNVRLAHEIHAIPVTSNGTTNLNGEQGATDENNINIPDWSYDMAGHIKEKRDHYYTLPYGFKTIKVENTDDIDEPKATINSNHTVADSTQDTLTIAASNYWIKLDNSEEDTIYIGHASPKADDVDSIGYQEEDITDLQFGDPFTLPYIFVDSKGHIADSGYYDITIPKGDFEDKKISGSTANTLTGITFDAPTGKISVTHDNAGNLLLTGLSAANSDTAWVQSTDSINTAFKKVDTRLDAEIARASKAEDDLNKRIDDLDYADTPDEGQVVYSVTQTDGAVTANHKNVGALLMSGYVKPTTLANQSLAATETLNTALGKLEYRLEDEAKARVDAITKEVSDRNTAIDNAINALDVSDIADATKYVSAVNESNGKITVSRASLPTLSSGSARGTVKLSNGNDVAVTGLGSAAYTNSDAYASATVLEDYQVAYDIGVTKTVADVFAIVALLEKEIATLKQEIETLKSYHSSNTEAPSEPIE